MTSAVKAIEALVRSVAENAAQGKVKLSDRIEALRSLAPYYAALTKHQPFQTGDDIDKTTISGLQNAVRKAEDSNGRTVSDHRRRGRPDPHYTTEVHEE